MRRFHIALTILLCSLTASAAPNVVKVTGAISPDSLRALGARTDITALDLSEASVGSAGASGSVIGKGAFFGSAISRITLPADTRSIGEAAFAASALTGMEIPEGVVEIGPEAFYQCVSLESVTLPSSLRRLGKNAFAGCSRLKDFQLDHTRVTTLPDGCLASTSALKKFSSSKVLEVGSHVFRGSGVEQITLPGVRTLADYALAEAPSLHHVSLPNRVSAGRGVLMGNPMLSRIDGTLTTLPELFAANSGAIRDGGGLQAATYVGAYALANSPVSVITLAQSLRRVEAGALSGCSLLTDIDARALGASMPVADAEAVSGIDPSKIRLIVAEATAHLWESDPVWGLFEVTTDFSTLGNDKVTDTSGGDAISLTYADGRISAASPAYPLAVAIYDASGRCLLQTRLADAADSVDTAGLPSGLLIIEARHERDSATLKLLK